MEAELDHAGWAALADVPEVELHALLADEGFAAECKSAAVKASVSGAAELPRLVKINALLLDKLEAGIPDMDTLEAVDALKVVSRLREHKDRTRLAEADHYDSLPLVIFNFGSSGMETKVFSPGEVVDVAVKEGPVAALTDFPAGGDAHTEVLDAFKTLAGAVPLEREGEKS